MSIATDDTKGGSVNTEITIHNVELLSLKERITGYRLLFGVEPMSVQLQGTFQHKSGELASLGQGFYELDISTMGRSRYLPIFVEGEWLSLAPMDDIIKTVRIS